MVKIYLKAAAAGTAFGLLFAMAWVFVSIGLPIVAAIVLSIGGSGGVGGAGGIVDEISTLLVAAGGFVLGFLWSLRRSRQPR